MKFQICKNALNVLQKYFSIPPCLNFIRRQGGILHFEKAVFFPFRRQAKKNRRTRWCSGMMHLPLRQHCLPSNDFQREIPGPYRAFFASGWASAASGAV